MSDESRTIRIGSRGSPLALAQVALVEAALTEKFPDILTELVVIKTSGDWVPSQGDVRLSDENGGKAQFAKEIEEALLAGEIDCAVHSMKDMDSFLPEGLDIAHMLPREDVRDAMLFSQDISNNSQKSDDVWDRLPDGGRVGTVSVRRAAFLLSKRPDLKIEPFRGNVQTRIDKVRGGQVDCTCLAMAGLNRLGLDAQADVILSPEEMLPAAGQGAVGIELRVDDMNNLAIFNQISDLNTVLCVKSERAALQALSGSCHSPIGAYARIKDGEIWLRVCVLSEDGQQRLDDEERADVSDVEGAQALGHMVGQRLKAIVPQGLLGD